MYKTVLSLTILTFLISTCTRVRSEPLDARYQLTQEQLAQYVAAQQTQQQQPQPQRYVTAAVPVPRHRQAVYRQQELEQDDGSREQQQVAYQLQQSDEAAGDAAAAYRQQPLVYYRPQQAAPAQRKYKLRPTQVRLLSGSNGQPQDEQQPDYDPNPQYQFSFDIKDDESTNYHNRKETRDGDKISGSYSVVDSDGYIRTVTYTADPQEGFKADVSRQPTDIVVKLPKHPTPNAGVAQQYQQISPAQALLARKQLTQQYLQAASPVEGIEQQYAVVKGQPSHAYSAGRAALVSASPAAAAYFTPHRLSPAVLSAAKSAKSYDPEQQSGASPLLYRTYQQQ